MPSPLCRLSTFVLVLGLVVQGSAAPAQTAGAPGPAPAAAPAGARPLGRPAPAFEQNVGQMDSRVRFRATAQAYGIFLSERESVVTLGRNGAASIRMAFAGAAPRTVRGEGERAGRVFHVSDPAKPASGAARFDRVRYVDAWPGTDIVFHGTDERQVRFDFELAPGADPGMIRLDFTGADDLAIEKNGDLAVTVAGQRAHVRKPVVFQQTAAGRRPVEGGFVADGARAVRFTLAGYDHALPLVIDPTIDFASYLGTGANEEVLWAETRSGSVYVSGRTWQSTSFPKVLAPAGDDLSAPHCFISKFTRDGSDLAWSVVFDWTGTLAHECGPFALGPDFKVHAALRFFLDGSRWGVSVFTEPDANGGIWAGSSFPVPELQPDQPVRIQADNAGNTYLAGSCSAGAYRDGDVVLPKGARTAAYLADCSSLSLYGNPPAFESLLLKIAPDGTRLYGTFIGGTPFSGGTGELYDRKPDTVRALVVDPVTEEAWVGGQAQSEDLPGTQGGLIDSSLHPPAYPSCGTPPPTESEPAPACMPNAFVTRVDTTKSSYHSITYGTYYGIRFASDGVTPISWNGTLADWFSVEDLALEPGGGVNLFGNIRRVGQANAPYDLFVARIVPMGSPQLAFQQAIIGSQFDTAVRLARRPNGDLVLGGFTNSPDFPQVGALFSPPTTTLMPYVSVLQPSTGDLLFSSALPGEPPAWPAGQGNPPREGVSLAVPNDDVVYAAWTTMADGLGQTVAVSGPFQNGRAGMKDAVVARFCFNASGCPTNNAPTITATPSPITVPLWTSTGNYVTLSAAVDDADNDALTVTWDLPSGPQSSTASSGDEVYATDLFPPGHSSVTVTVTDPWGGTATATIEIDVVPNTPAGSGVNVRPGNDSNPQSGGGAGVTVVGDVQAPGNTLLSVRNDLNPMPDAGRQLGSPPYYYDVWTTATFAAPPTVCIDIRGHGFADPNAAIYRHGGGTWSALPTTASVQSPGLQQLCAPVPLSAAPATLAIMTPEVPANRILTLAGTAPWDPVNDRCLGVTPDPAGGVTATSTRLYYPAGAVFAAAQNAIYFAEKCGFRVRKLNLGTGTITTLTGTGTPSLGDAASVSTDPAVATFKSPTGVALDPAGNLYIADSGNCRIRKLYLDAAGNPNRVATVAGTGVCGLSGDGGPAAAAQLGSDLYIRTDAGGVLYVSDGDRVRRIIPGQPGDGSIDGNPDELITTYAGGGTGTPGAAAAPATSLALGKALGSAPSAGGDLYVAYLDGVLRVDASGQASRVRQTGQGVYGPVGDSLALLSNGELAWGSSSCRGNPDWQCFGRVNRLTKGSDGFVNGSADETESPLAGYRDWAELPLATPPAPPRNSNGDGHGLSARLQTPASLVPLPNGSFIIADADNGLLRLVGSLTGGPANTPPYASAGPSYAVNVNDRAYLDGSGSGDEDNDALTYRWTLLSKPLSSVASLIDATAVTAVLIPDVPGVYRVQLVVNDGTSDSAPAHVEITVSNRAPLANAGPDQTATLQGPEGPTTVLFRLDGTASSDPDGQALSYEWTVWDSDNVPHTITGANPELDLIYSGVRSILLTVSDGTLTGADWVDLTVVNPKPVADAGPDQAVHFPGGVTLTGSGTDPNGDAIAGWSWSVFSKPAGATATLGADQAQSTFFSADKPGRYEVQFSAGDGWGWSAPDTVVVDLTDASPVAAPDAATSLAGNAVVIDLLANDSDADGDEFMLTATGTPGRGTITLLDAAGTPPRRFVYRPTDPGDSGTDSFTYTITTVAGGAYLSASATGTVTVTMRPNRPPTAVGRRRERHRGRGDHHPGPRQRLRRRRRPHPACERHRCDARDGVCRRTRRQLPVVRNRRCRHAHLHGRGSRPVRQPCEVLVHRHHPRDGPEQPGRRERAVAAHHEFRRADTGDDHLLLRDRGGADRGESGHAAVHTVRHVPDRRRDLRHFDHGGVHAAGAGMLRGHLWRERLRAALRGRVLGAAAGPAAPGREADKPADLRPGLCDDEQSLAVRDRHEAHPGLHVFGFLQPRGQSAVGQCDKGGTRRAGEIQPGRRLRAVDLRGGLSARREGRLRHRRADSGFGRDRDRRHERASVRRVSRHLHLRVEDDHVDGGRMLAPVAAFHRRNAAGCPVQREEVGDGQGNSDRRRRPPTRRRQRRGISRIVFVEGRESG